MALQIQPDRLTEAIDDILKEYGVECQSTLCTVAEDVGKETTKKLKKTSPKLSGRYAKGWRLEFKVNKLGDPEFVVYNKTDYQLTHLLEFSHPLPQGGRSKEYPHIKPAQEDAEKKLITKLKEKLQ